MNALILGGKSPRHKAWVRELAAALAPHFDEVVYLDYKHWDTPDATADITAEMQAAGRLAETLGEYVIIAKSLGTVITTLGCAARLLRPQRCIFLGFPLSLVEKEFPELPVSLRAVPSLLFVQNAHDPLGSFADVNRYVQVHSLLQARVTETPGDTHDYVDFDVIAKLAR